MAEVTTEMSVPGSDNPRVVIVGCGFAGLNAAKKINSKKYQVVLIDKDNYHTFQPLMYQVATAGLEPDSIAYPVRNIFRHQKGFHFRMAEVQKIDAESSAIETDIGRLKYNHLILATGADTNYFGMSDVEANAYSMKYLTEALDLRSIILQNFERALIEPDPEKQEALMHFVIVGAGPTGVELAGALAELKSHVLPGDYPDLDIAKMQIHLMEADKEVLAPMSDNASKKAKKFLEKMGVNVWLEAMVESYDGHTVKVKGKDPIQAETLIWAAGVAGRPVEGLSVESMAPGNRFPVDEFLKVKGFDNIYAMGDVAGVITEDLPKGHPMLASVAMQQGKYLGNAFNRRLKGKEVKPFKYNDKGTMATVGRNRAVVDFKRKKMSGTIAWYIWMFVHLMLLVGFRNRVVVFFNWAWSYINFNRGTRLIVRKVNKK